MSLFRCISKRSVGYFFIAGASFSVLFASVSAGVIANDYSALLDGDEIAQLSFSKLAPQQYQLTLLDVESGIEHSFVLMGDQWQVDARVIQVEVLGLNALYRLERINGRYLTVKQEKTSPKSVYSLSNQGIMPDVWGLLKRCTLCLVREEFGSATYMPMQDGARFSVSISNHGLLSTPINAQARDAVANW